MTRSVFCVCLLLFSAVACSVDSPDPGATQSPSGGEGAGPQGSGADSSSGGDANGGGPSGGDTHGGDPSGGDSSGGDPSGGTASGGEPAGGTEATTGGASSTGGATSSSGATGGGADAGGEPSTGGTSDAGGETSTGGTASTGGTGGSDVCAWDEGPSATNGGLTCYWFEQGTAKDENTCPGGYKTYCGYCGGETGERPQGDGQVWCPINDVVSTVQHISTEHFVAIPMTPLGQGSNCGMCVEVSYMGRTIVATVVDACPSCLTDEHIDLNMSAAAALGMTEIMGQVESGVAWRVVGCPVTDDIQVNFNGGYQGQVYFQNVAFPIASASSGGREASANTGFWDFGMEMGGQEVTLTDVMGHTVTATVPSAPGSLGVQFDQTCQ